MRGERQAPEGMVEAKRVEEPSHFHVIIIIIVIVVVIIINFHHRHRH